MLFESFVLVYPALVAVNSGWNWRKIISRYVWIIIAIVLTRLVTFVWQTHDATSIAWATECGRADVSANAITLWERQYGFETHGQDELNESMVVVSFCLCTIAVCAMFYFNPGPARALNQGIMGKKAGGRTFHR